MCGQAVTVSPCSWVLNVVTIKHTVHEPRHGKTNILYAKTKAQIIFAEDDQRLCFRYTDSAIPLLSKSKISSHYTVFVQLGLCQTCSGKQNCCFFSCSLVVPINDCIRMLQRITKC